MCVYMIASMYVCMVCVHAVSPELPRRVQRPVEEVSSDHPAGNMTAISYRNLISQGQ